MVALQSAMTVLPTLSPSLFVEGMTIQPMGLGVQTYRSGCRSSSICSY